MLHRIEDSELIDLSAKACRDHSWVEPPLDGIPVSEAQIVELRESIVSLAKEHGFPSLPLRRGNVRSFDRPAGGLLHDLMHLSPADAARPEVWNYVSLIVLPDVAAWRFPSREVPRMLGAGFGDSARRRNRNAFGRLWWATEVLGYEARLASRDPCGDPLGEDEIVGIMERSSAIAPSPLVARLLASSGRCFYFEHSKAFKTLTVGRTEFFRKLFVLITRIRAVLNISVLSEEEISEMIDDACRAVLEALPAPASGSPS